MGYYRYSGRHYPHSRQYTLYLKSKEWQRKRQAFIKRSRGKCERCNRKPRRIEVHHKHYRTLGQERHEDVEVLCPQCHRQADQERVNRRQKPPTHIRRNTAKKYAQSWLRRLSVDDKEILVDMLEDT